MKRDTVLNPLICYQILVWERVVHVFHSVTGFLPNTFAAVTRNQTSNCCRFLLSGAQGGWCGAEGLLVREGVVFTSVLSAVRGQHAPPHLHHTSGHHECVLRQDLPGTLDGGQQAGRYGGCQVSYLFTAWNTYI